MYRATIMLCLPLLLACGCDTSVTPTEANAQPPTQTSEESDVPGDVGLRSTEHRWALIDASGKELDVRVSPFSPGNLSGDAPDTVRESYSDGCFLLGSTAKGSISNPVARDLVTGGICPARDDDAYPRYYANEGCTGDRLSPNRGIAQSAEGIVYIDSEPVSAWGEPAMIGGAWLELSPGNCHFTQNDSYKFWRLRPIPLSVLDKYKSGAPYTLEWR